MHWRRLLILSVTVGVLALIALRPKDEATDRVGPVREPLFPGLDPALVMRVQVEYLDRLETVEVERSPFGAWRVVRPYSARALSALPQQLIELAARATAEETLGFERAAVDLEDPPIRLTFIERTPDGVEREWQLEVGDPDTDGQRMFALLDGRIVRVPRSFKSLVDLGTDNWRDKRLLGVPHQSVLSFKRYGAIPEANGTVPKGFEGELELEAQFGDEGWWAISPVPARLSPAAIESLRIALANFNGRAVLDADGDRRSMFGLEQPAFGFRVELRDGSIPELSFGRFVDGPGDASWTVVREREEERDEGGTIYAVLENDVRLLTQPFTNLLEYDPINAIARTVVEVEVRLDRAGLRLERPSGEWWASDPERVRETAVRAEVRQASEILQELLDVPFTEFFDLERGREIEPLGSIRLVLDDESVIEGDLGPLVDAEGTLVPEGTDGADRLFRRDGEGIWGRLEQDLGRFARLRPLDLERLTVTRESELEQRSIEAEGPAGRRTWMRDPDRGLWFQAGSTTEDTSFALQIDGLLNLEVAAWIPTLEVGEVTDVTTVRLTRLDETTLEFDLARARIDGEAAVVALLDGKAGRVPDRVLEGLERELLR
ncbi:MAG: DUF4340 domain-containing protein [Planctomycetota bacterium]|jgi:hypothetical protein